MPRCVWSIFSKAECPRRVRRHPASRCVTSRTLSSMIAIISDIHGNIAALRSVLAEIDRMGVRQIVCLGDVAGYYSEVNNCVETLRGTGCPRSTSANRCLEYQRRTITDDNLRWLAESPLRASFDGVSMVHGGWNDPVDEYLYDVSRDYFAGLDGTRFASGHTHMQGVWPLEPKVY